MFVWLTSADTIRFGQQEAVAISRRATAFGQCRRWLQCRWHGAGSAQSQMLGLSVMNDRQHRVGLAAETPVTSGGRKERQNRASCALLSERVRSQYTCRTLLVER